MKLLILYHDKSDHALSTESYAKDIERFGGLKPELISLETVEGDHNARLYDITQYPAIVAIKNDGQMSGLWQGLPLPLINEVVGACKQ